MLPPCRLTEDARVDGTVAVLGDGESEGRSDLALFLVAQVVYRESLRRRCWTAWQERAVRVSERRHHQGMLAAQYYAYNVTYLFFRAWQWSFHDRGTQRRQAAKAQEFWTRYHQRRFFCSWIALVRLRRERYEQILRSADVQVSRLAHSYWRMWARFVSRSTLSTALQAVSSQVHGEVRLKTWMAYCVLQLESRFHFAASKMHQPHLWHLLLSDGNRRRVLDAQDVAALIQRHTWIQWLRVTCDGRAKRIAHNDQRIQTLQRAVELSRRARYWQRWLLVTASVLQSRKRSFEQRQRAFTRWKSYAEDGRRSKRMSDRLLHEGKRRALAMWNRASCKKQRIREHLQRADAHYQAVVQERLRTATWVAWRTHQRRRIRRRDLKSKAERARQRLLEHIAVRRLVDGVMGARRPPPVAPPGAESVAAPSTQVGLKLPLPLPGKRPAEGTRAAPNGLPGPTAGSPQVTQTDMRTAPPQKGTQTARRVAAVCHRGTQVEESDRSFQDSSEDAPHFVATSPAFTRRDLSLSDPVASDLHSIHYTTTPIHMEDRVRAYAQAIAPRSPPIPHGREVHQHVDPYGGRSTPHRWESHRTQRPTAPHPPTSCARTSLPLAPAALPPVAHSGGHRTSSWPLAHAPPPPNIDWTTATPETLQQHGRHVVSQLQLLQRTSAAEAEERTALQEELAVLEELVASTKPLGSAEHERMTRLRLESVRERFLTLLQHDLRRQQLQAQVKQLATVLELRVGVDTSSTHTESL